MNHALTVAPASSDVRAPPAKVALDLGGLFCATCAGTIATALRQVPGVHSVRVDATRQRAQIEGAAKALSLPALVDAVRAVGYDAWPQGTASSRERRAAEARRMAWRLFVAAFCMMQVMMFAAPGWLYDASEIAADTRQLLNWGAWLMTVPVVLFSAGDFIRGAWQSLRRGRVDMNLPVAIAVGVTFWAGTVATFHPAGPLGDAVYFDSLTMFVTFLLAGRWFEMRLRHRAWAEHERHLGAVPQPVARVRDSGAVEWIDAAEVAEGDRLRVASGAVFAADGRVMAGTTQADESLVTGESTPVPKAPGDAVLGGSVNVGAPVDMQATRVGSASRQGVIEALMGQAEAMRPATAAIDDRFAQGFTLAVLLLAALGYALWEAVGSAQTHSTALWVAVSVLIVTCPCALSLAAPSARRATAQALLQERLLVKDPAMIERLARVSHLMIDKTGTLTQALPTVSEVQVTGVLKTTEVADLSQHSSLGTVRPEVSKAFPQLKGLRYLSPNGELLQSEPYRDLTAAAAALAAWSRHPKARAVAALAEGDGASLPAWAHWQAVQEQPGLGLEATDDVGRRFRLGAPQWAGGDASDDCVLFLQIDPPTPSVGLRFVLHDTLRPDAAPTLQALARAGLRLTLLSGDQASRVEAVVRTLGLGDDLQVRSGLTPEQKLQQVRAAQAAGEVVAMVGDGLNDAPVLAAADVSIAMGQGVDAARARADAVLLGDALRPLVTAHALAKRTALRVRSNLRWAAAYNFACVPLALMGWLPPWAAGLGMAATSLFVVARSQKLR